MEKEESKNEESKNEESKNEETNKITNKNFVRTISCPNCPINCYTVNGALRHAAECNKKREQKTCCLCKTPNIADYYDPEKKRYWYLCWKCYRWAKNKLICL